MERKYKQENGNYLQENINMFKVKGWYDTVVFDAAWH